MIVLVTTAAAAAALHRSSRSPPALTRFRPWVDRRQCVPCWCPSSSCDACATAFGRSCSWAAAARHSSLVDSLGAASDCLWPPHGPPTSVLSMGVAIGWNLTDCCHLPPHLHPRLVVSRPHPLQTFTAVSVGMVVIFIGLVAFRAHVLPFSLPFPSHPSPFRLSPAPLLSSSHILHVPHPALLLLPQVPPYSPLGMFLRSPTRHFHLHFDLQTRFRSLSLTAPPDAPHVIDILVLFSD
jgi:hypothetical protein